MSSIVGPTVSIGISRRLVIRLVSPEYAAAQRRIVDVQRHSRGRTQGVSDVRPT
jgi:hypothetical protein